VAWPGEGQSEAKPIRPWLTQAETFFRRLTLAKTGRTFSATEEVAGVICNSVGRQFPEHSFSLHLLPYHERSAVFYYEIRIEGESGPKEVGTFLDEFLSRLFPGKDAKK
jgi:hypothetical protein